MDKDLKGNWNGLLLSLERLAWEVLDAKTVGARNSVSDNLFSLKTLMRNEVEEEMKKEG